MVAGPDDERWVMLESSINKKMSDTYRMRDKEKIVMQGTKVDQVYFF